MKVITLIIRVLVALILLQTLYFKFTAHPESVHIFTVLDLEPNGRIGIGILELIASVLLLWSRPKVIAFGAVLSFGLMAGALFFHFTKLGIVVNGSSTLFILGLVAFIGASVIALLYRKHIPLIGKLFA